ncbi:MAG: 50S ribosomal protein L18Ae [Thermoplasmatota archaeon]
MSKQAYTVEGDFQMGRIRQHFAIQVIGANEDEAKEYALADLGSRHGVARRLVDIQNVAAVADGDLDPITKKRLARGA